jgi:hypothetical protein
MYSMFKLTYIKGNLFSSKNNLAHCVSKDFKMGKGIAVEFKKRFGRVEELKGHNCNVGKVTFLYIPDQDRFIYYLITKEKYYEKPTLQTLRSSLISLKDLMIKHNKTTLSIPKIGCGLDRLLWEDVESLIKEVFSNTDIKLYVYYI